MLLATLTLHSGPCRAVPAYPRPIRITQSDGTQLTVRLIGDERFHYMLSSEGYTLTGGPDGDLYYAMRSATGTLVPTTVKARPLARLDARERAVVADLGKEVRPAFVRTMNSVSNPPDRSPLLRAGNKPTPPQRMSGARTTGKLKSLIILIEYADQSFASAGAQSDFRNLLMEDGYSANGATGSAWNYYRDNSGGQFDPEFVVVGPYRAAHPSEYYAREDAYGNDNARELIVEACRAADREIDFTQFADNGIIRDVFVFYAGRNQADTGDTRTIWPHRWDVRSDSRYQSVYLDGMHLRGYACSSELKADYRMAGIGTFCHEFGHVLGWPDFYDTDYTGSGGQAPALEHYSLMCMGSYNNEGRTPPALGILERWMAGWAEPEVIDSAGDRLLPPVSQNKGYLVATPTAGEYFLLESRNPGGDKWDRYLSETEPGGLLVYHIDYTPSVARKWYYENTLNCNPSHECLKLVRSVPVASGTQSVGRTFFPGSNGVTVLSASRNMHYKAWNDDAPQIAFGGIAIGDEGAVRMKALATTRLELRAEPRQYDALLSWEGDPQAEWIVGWKSDAGTSGEKRIRGNAYHLNGLSPGTACTATVSQVSDEVSCSNTIVFRTASTSADRSTRIDIAAGGYTHDKPFTLSLLDYPRKVKRIEWFVDDRPVVDTYVALAAGEHRLTAVVTDASDGSQRYLVKYITVK